MNMPNFEHLNRIATDIKKAAVTLGDDEVRYLTSTYYQMQDTRIRSSNRLFASSENQLPNSTLNWVAESFKTIEEGIASAMEVYTINHPVGMWMRRVHGIGPILSAGLLSHLDVHKSQTAGGFWRYAGLDPTVRWNKGEKCPWNPSLKVMCWKVGEAFVKVSGNPDAYYGQLYKKRKEYETEKNERGEYANQAKEMLERFNFSKTTEAYKHYIKGKLPPGHIHSRAKRYAVKMFLSHLHEEMYLRILNQEPPKPFAISILGHAHHSPSSEVNLKPEKVNKRKSKR